VCLYCILTDFSLDICPGMVLLDQMVVLSVFSGTSTLLSTVVLLIYIPTDGITSLPTFIVCVLNNYSDMKS
jgi:hypothetical protein